MPQNWKTYKLKEVAKLTTGFAFKSKDYEMSGDLRVIRGKNITEGYLRWGDDSRFWNHTIDKLEKYLVKVDDIVIGMDGSKIGKNRAIVREGDLPTILAQRVGRVQAKKNITDQKYLWQLINNNAFENYVNNIKTGTSIPHISLGQIGNFEINLPPLPEQKAIANILSAIDAKIENNLAINKTLEEMAVTLYKEWFVDFGPFQNGKFVESELGMIPEGWEVKRLDDILEIKRGGSPRPIKDFISDSGLPWLKISDATAANSPFQYSTKEYIKPEGLKKTVLIKPGAIILSNSATPGLPRLIEFETCIHDGWLHFPEIRRFNRYYLYLLFLDIREHLISQGNGSVFTNLKTDILKSQNIKIPPFKIEEQFLNKVNSKFEKIRENTLEIQTLTNLRDTLLPKLISGEVRLKEFDLEEVLEE